MGKKFEKETLDGYRSQGCGVDTDVAELARIRAIMERIVAVSHRPDTPLTLHLLEAEEFNAFATVGGYVFVNRGLLQGDLAVRSDDELAAILGHEWAHVTAGHIAERISRGQVDADLVKSRIYLASFSTEAEDEADRVGILYAALAGFDPMASSAVWERMADRKGGGGDEFLHDHPVNAQRAESTRRYGMAAAAYRVPGEVHPQAQAILEDNAVTGKREASDGFAALLAGASEYYSQGERTRAEVEARRAKRAGMEEAFSREPGVETGMSFLTMGKYGAAVVQFQGVLHKNPANYLAAFECARGKALCGDSEGALQELAVAVMNGYHDARRIRQEPAFASLLGDPRLAEILQVARANK